MGERDDDQDQRGDDRPTRRKGKRVPVPTDLFNDGSAHIVVPDNGQLGNDDYDDDKQDEVVKLTDNGTSNFCEQPTLS